MLDCKSAAVKIGAKFFGFSTSEDTPIFLLFWVRQRLMLECKCFSTDSINFGYDELSRRVNRRNKALRLYFALSILGAYW